GARCARPGLCLCLACSPLVAQYLRPRQDLGHGTRLPCLAAACPGLLRTEPAQHLALDPSAISRRDACQPRILVDHRHLLQPCAEPSGTYQIEEVGERTARCRERAEPRRHGWLPGTAFVGLRIELGYRAAEPGKIECRAIALQELAPERHERRQPA